MKTDNAANSLRQVFSQNLNRYMENRGETISDISSALSIPFSTVSDWVHGRKYPRMDKVQMLADYFVVQKSDLTEEKSTPVSEDGLGEKTKEVLDMLSKLTPQNREIALAQLDVLIKHQEKQDTD